MSVIQRIRDKGAWIVFGIIALALIAFILQDGVRRGGRAFSNTDAIGKINGQKISKADFDEKVQLQEQMYAGQGAQREQILTSVWNQEIEMAVLGQEYEKLGLRVGQKELADILYGPNSPLKSQFTDPKTGEFMAENARQTMAQVKKSKNTDQQKMINTVFIDPAIQQTLRTKYQNLLIQAAYVPKWLLEKQHADNNAIASFSYVYVPYASISDSTSKVSDDEIEAYVKKHKSEFNKAEETRNISFVSFSAAPSAADSAAALNQVLAVKNEFATTTDNQAFLTKASSEMPYYDSYFSKSRMQQSNKDTLVKIPTGQLYGPYLDGPNYVIAKMIGSKQWPDSAKVRHILIGTTTPQGQPIREDSVAKKLADSVETAIKGGADFNALVLKYSDDQGSKDKAGVYEIPQGQMVIPFNDFAFDKPVGAKGIVKTDFGYHYMEVLEHKGNNPVYKLAYLAKGINASAETENAANTAAAQFAVSSKSSKDFNNNVVKGNIPMVSATDIKQNDFIVQGIGSSRQLVRWIYESGVGDVSDPVQVGDKYIVAMVSAVNKAGLATAAEARPMVENIVRNEKKAKIIIDTKFKGNTLESYSAASGAPILHADSLSFAAPFISGIGSEPKVVGAVFNKASLNKVSSPIAGATGVFGLKVENMGAKAATMDLVTIKQNMLQSSRMVSYRGLDALKKAAEVKDYRSKFF
jgi:peptidyl-prolyl cis-trans isomerase D